MFSGCRWISCSPPEMHGNDSRSWKHLCRWAPVNNHIPPSSLLIYILFWWDIFFHPWHAPPLLFWTVALILDHANSRRKATTTPTGYPDVKLGSFGFYFFFFLCLIKHITAISAFTQSPYFSLIACQLFCFFATLDGRMELHLRQRAVRCCIFCNHLTLQLFLFCFSLDTFCKVRHSMFEYSSLYYFLLQVFVVFL